MDAEHLSRARRVLLGTPAADGKSAAEVLATAPAIELAAGESYFRSSLPAGAFLIVERGFVVVRTDTRRMRGSVITCEAGPGRIVLPPTADEALSGLVDSQLTVVTHEALDELLALPGVARTLLEQLAETLAQKQEAIGTFGNTRHIDRVRRKLLQLARAYGRVAPDGVRIDFPLSHGVLADMVGSSRETVTRSLDRLQRDGFVARRGRTYRLLVPPDHVAAAM